MIEWEWEANLARQVEISEIEYDIYCISLVYLVKSPWRESPLKTNQSINQITKWLTNQPNKQLINQLNNQQTKQTDWLTNQLNKKKKQPTDQLNKQEKPSKQPTNQLTNQGKKKSNKNVEGHWTNIMLVKSKPDNWLS